MASAAAAAKEFVQGPCVPETVQKLLQAFPFAKLCEALGNAQAADREALITTLEKLAGFDEVCSSFFGDESVVLFLRQGAHSGDARITKMVAGLMERLATTDSGVGMLVKAELLADLESLLLDHEVGTAQSAGQAICKCATQPAGRDAVLVGDNGMVSRLQGRLQQMSETQQIRVLSLFVELGRVSESEIFPLLEKAGVFKSVLAAFLTDDILMKLNAVELMESLGSYAAGQRFISQPGVPEQLVADLSDPCCDDSVKLCVVRLLGFVLQTEPTLMSTLLPQKQAIFAQMIPTLLESRDLTQKLCALQAFGNICCSDSGLEFFFEWTTVYNMVITMVSSPHIEVCKAAIAAWGNMLGSRPPKNGATGAAAELWKRSEEDVLPQLLKCITQKPFPDVRTFTWKLLTIFVSSQDSARKMLVSNEMREKLLDFTSETSSDAKIAKHEFVQALIDHQGSWLGAFLDPNIEELLSEYAKRSAFWMPQVSAVNVAEQTG